MLNLCVGIAIHYKFSNKICRVGTTLPSQRFFCLAFSVVHVGTHSRGFLTCDNINRCSIVKPEKSMRARANVACMRKRLI